VAARTLHGRIQLWIQYSTWRTAAVVGAAAQAATQQGRRSKGDAAIWMEHAHASAMRTPGAPGYWRGGTETIRHCIASCSVCAGNAECILRACILRVWRNRRISSAYTCSSSARWDE
jgi:hypothetical protein